MIVLISGCRSTKKATKSNIETKTESVIKTENKVTDKVKEAKNLNVITTTTTTKTEFNKPDSTGTVTVSDKGSVKSIEVTVTTTKQTDNGKIETEHKEEAKTATDNKEYTKTKVEVTEKAKVPIRWGWIFGILVLLTGLAVYLRNSPVAIWLKSVLSKMAGFFKI